MLPCNGRPNDDTFKQAIDYCNAEDLVMIVIASDNRDLHPFITDLVTNAVDQDSEPGIY